MAKIVLSKEEILHLARLARLTLTEEQIKKYQAQLGDTIDYVKVLDELDVTGVQPTNSVVDLKNVTYKDGASSINGLTTIEAIQNGKKVKDNEFVVDRIME